ncbi:gastrin/cholecystokinin type B receptor-like [Lineus longissimus]|uniref:gastrin/cholecystokinin type B receptor-like n=1 Tax=Lineus longissimus TaxID=88925 RepID=UPI002B4E839E
MAGALSFIGLAAVVLAVYSQSPRNDGASTFEPTNLAEEAPSSTLQPPNHAEYVSTVKGSSLKTIATTSIKLATTTPRPKPPRPCFIQLHDKLRFYADIDEVYDYLDSRVKTSQNLVPQAYYKCVDKADATREQVKTCMNVPITAIETWQRTRAVAWYDFDPNLYRLFAFYKQVLSLLIPFILGVIGNSLVLFTIFSYLKTRTVTNILLAALATTDLLTMFVSVPVKIFQRLKPDAMTLGVVGCPAIYYLQWLFYHASIYTLVVIALERFLTICYPLKSKTISTPSTTKIILVIVWILALVFSIPASFFYVEYDILKDVNSCYPMYGCGDHASSRQQLYYKLGEIAYTIQYVIVGCIMFNYIIPLTFMVGAYGAVSVSLIKSIRAGREMKAAASNEQGKTDDDADAKKRFKIVKMLIMIVVLFALFWAPYIVWMVMYIFPSSAGDFSDNAVHWIAFHNRAAFELGLSIVYGLAYANSCVNPFIYLFMSKSFRDGFLYAVGCRKGRDPRMSSAASKNTMSTRAASSAADSSAAA